MLFLEYLNATNFQNMTPIKINQYISEEKAQILQLIDKHHKVLLQSNPASGKTFFFKELAKDIINGKRKGRLVFIAPLLIIQEQFKKSLQIDLELHGTSTRKTLSSTDKIITSTYKSFHHISDELNSDDIVVVDEAHALLYNYLQPDGTRDFFVNVTKNLYLMKAKLVLMSGTPNLCLLQIFGAHHIQVQRTKETQANININFSKAKNLNVALEFAYNAIDEHGTGSLNIIYRKSVKECHKIAQMLSDNGFKAQVLTSFDKAESTYQSIVDLELIPTGMQFLVTTNVISTGANIKNTNIGGALMLDEFNSQEIKQFSKRFRNKLDITVEVVNKPYLSGVSTLTHGQIQQQRNYLNDALKFHTNALDKPQYDFNYDKAYQNNDNINSIAPESHIGNILERYLMQESYYIDEDVRTIDESEELTDQLNEYDDINAETSYDYDFINKMDTATYDGDWEDKKDLLIDYFKDHTQKYISALCNEKNIDTYRKHKVKRLVKGEFSTTGSYDKSIIDNIHSPVFRKEILQPFIEYREYFKSTEDFIKFLKSDKNRNGIIATLQIHDIREQYFDLRAMKEGYTPTRCKYFHELKLKTIRTHSADDLSILLKLIEKTFNYCWEKEFISYESLKEYLEKDKELKKMILGASKLKMPPINTIKLKKKSFELNMYVVKALVQAIFYVNPKRVRKVIKGNKQNGVGFYDSLPSGYKTPRINYSDNLYAINKRIKDIHNTTSKNILIKKSKEAYKYLSNYELLIDKFI